MYNSTSLNRRFVFEGNELLGISLSFPCPESCPIISDFYRRLSENFIKWCEEQEFPALCEEYNGVCKEKYIYRKHFRSLSAEVTYFSDNLVCILTEIKARDAQGRRTVLSEYQVWNLPEEFLLPPEYALRLICRELGLNIPKLGNSPRSVGTDGYSVFAE